MYRAVPAVNSIALTDSVFVFANSSGNTASASLTLRGLVNSLPLANSTNPGLIIGGPNLVVNSTGYIKISLPGPYDDDPTASGAGVPVSGFYYTSGGVLKIRLV
jgi:hypothetical protein